MKSINQLLAEELQVNDSQINAAVALMDDGATVPFIARYRKEATDWTTRNCAVWKNVWAICGSWKNGAILF